MTKIGDQKAHKILTNIPVLKKMQYVKLNCCLFFIRNNKTHKIINQIIDKSAIVNICPLVQ